MYGLVDFSKEEAVVIEKEMQDLLNKYSAQFYIKRLISEEGKIEAVLQLFKKVKLPEEGVKSPFITDGGENPKQNSPQA